MRPYTRLLAATNFLLYSRISKNWHSPVCCLPPIFLTSTHWGHMGRSLPMHVTVPCIWELQLTHTDMVAQTLPLMICSSFNYFLLYHVYGNCCFQPCSAKGSIVGVSSWFFLSIQVPWLPCDLSPLIFSRKVL